MRLVGVDFGRKRIGLAVMETDARVPTPRGTIPAVGTLAKDAVAIHNFAASEHADAIVLGVPQPFEGQDDRMARVCRMLADHLRGLGATVHLVDEAFTSIAAEEQLRNTGLTAGKRKELRDAEAACQILERYLP